MNSKLVLWGANAQDEKILVAMELLVEENKVKILTFPDKIVTDDFYEKMRNDWRDGKDVAIIEGFTEEIRDLTASETLLPEHIKVERTDLIERKQLEWHVLVLSSKMYVQFKSELESIKEKVDRLDTFDSAQWENLKTFWAKVQNQIRDGIISRGYANDLRKGSDELFDKLKALRKKLDEEYRSVAKDNFDWFSTKLDAVEGKIEEGLKLSGVFDELKDLQRKFHNTKFTREFRDKIWSRIDGSFKSVKEKKYGKNASNDSSALGRMNNRYEGLLKAIKRSEYSRDRDLKDLEYENRRIQNTDGQLEAQIREAKIKMINQRLKFKEEKLKEMHATKEQLDSKMAKLKEKEKLDKIRKEKAAAAKAKIQEEVKQTKENMDDATKQKLAAAAEEINMAKKKPKKKDFMEKAMDTVDEMREMIEEKLDDAIIATKAAAIVITDEVGEKMEPYTEKGIDVVQDLTVKANEKINDVKESFSAPKDGDEVIEDAKEEGKGFFDKAMDAVDDIREKVEEKAIEAKDVITEKIAEDKENKGFFSKAMDAVENIKDTIEDTFEDVVEKVEPITEKGIDVVQDLTVKASGKIEEEKEKGGFFSKAMDAVENIKDTIEDTLDDVIEKVEPYAAKGKEVVDDLKTTAGEVVEDVKDVASDAKDVVVEKADDIKDDVADLGDDILELDDLDPKV